MDSDLEDGSIRPVPSETTTAPRESDATFDRSFALAYDELRAIAHRHMARRARFGDPSHTISTTVLVNEAYLKLVEQSHGFVKDRTHFLSVAAVAMRHILIDRARANTAQKRGGAEAAIVTLDEEAIVTLDEEAMSCADDCSTLLEINEALDRLAVVDARLAKVVECRFFGGLSEEEIAAVLGLTVRTVQRDWSKARTLLRREFAR